MIIKKCSKCNVEPEVTAEFLKVAEWYKKKAYAEIKCPVCGKKCRGLAKGENISKADAVETAAKEWNEKEHLH